MNRSSCRQILIGLAVFLLLFNIVYHNRSSQTPPVVKPDYSDDETYRRAIMKEGEAQRRQVITNTERELELRDISTAMKPMN